MWIFQDWFEQISQDLFHFRSSLEKQLCASSDQSGHKHSPICLLFFLNDLFKDIRSLFDLISKLSKDPDVRGPSWGFRNLWKTLSAEVRLEISDEVRVLSQNIFKDQNDLICHVIDGKLQEVSHLPGDSLRNVINPYDYSAEAPYWPFSDICVDVCDILTQFTYNFLDIAFTSDKTQNFKLYIFDIRRLIVLDEELFILILKIWISSPLYQQVNVRKHVEWDLKRLSGLTWGHQGNQWSLKPLQHLVVKTLIFFG